MEAQDQLEWDGDNEDYIIGKHAVWPFEVEEAVRDRGALPFPAHSGRTGMLCRTEDGRILVVILQRAGNRLWRPITAYEPNSKVKKSYRRRNR